MSQGGTYYFNGEGVHNDVGLYRVTRSYSSRPFLCALDYTHSTAEIFGVREGGGWGRKEEDGVGIFGVREGGGWGEGCPVLQMSENNSGCLSFVMGQKFLVSGKEEDRVGRRSMG